MRIVYMRSIDIMKDWFSRGDLSIKDVIEDITMMPIDADRTSGLNPDNIDEFNKQKAQFFSENIINLERKDYSALAAKQDTGSELNFVRGIHNLLQENDYHNAMNWKVPKEIILPDEKLLVEICRYSYVKRFLVKEVTLLNSLMTTIQEDLETLRLIDRGVYATDPTFTKMKEKLCTGMVPRTWRNMSSIAGLSFKKWKDIIKLRHHNLSKQAVLLERDSKIFNLKWFANPKGLLEAIMLDASYRRAPSTKFDDIIMTFKVTNIFERNIEQLSEEEYHVLGLRVKNAYVDRTKAELSDKLEANCTDEFPAILVQCKYAKRAAADKTETKGYLCPVVSGFEDPGIQAKEQQVLFKVVVSLVSPSESIFEGAESPPPTERNLPNDRVKTTHPRILLLRFYFPTSEHL